MALAVPAGAGAHEGRDGGSYKNITVTWAAYLPCTGVPVEITATIGGSAHTTSNGDGEGLTGTKLVLNLKTVRNSVSNIFAKLHVADRTQAIIRARDAGLGNTTGIHQ